MNPLLSTIEAEAPALVSVVIPTKGRPGIVQRAVKSALGQTLHEIEVIVVIDGDDPETVASLRLEKDQRLRTVILPISRGAAEARNVGVQNARTNWIAFLDDDDEWLPQKLETQLLTAMQASALLPVVCSAYIARSAEGDALFGRRAPSAEEAVSEYMFCRTGFSYGENALATSVLFVPKALMLLVPFDATLKRHQDWDWALRALSVPDTRLCYVSDVLSIYHMPEGLARVSGHSDWRYSLAWCLYRKALMTPRAISFFIATECLTRARDAHAGPRDLAVLVKAYLQEGQPTFRSALLGLTYLLISKRVRRLILRRSS